MIIFFGDGELGNQLFQFAFIKKIIKKKEKLVTTNFTQLKDLINIDNLINFENKFLVFIFRKLLIYFFIIFSYLRIFNSINVKKKRVYGTVLEENFLIKKRGLLPIVYIFPCFFQSEFFFGEIKYSQFKFKKKYSLKAKNFLKKIPKKFKLIFVHVRQGKSYYYDKYKTPAIHYRDYKIINFLGKRGIALPINYYKKNIKWFVKNIQNPYFIFLTDNIQITKKYFSFLKNKQISTNEVGVDFHIMINCKYGILSNSSISWWGGYLMKNRKILFGPKYWLGWKRKIEFQAGAEPSFAKLQDPNNF